MITDDVLRKVRKCLALAASANPGEAEAAMRQAQTLMRIHGITEGALDRAAVMTAHVRGKAGQKPAEWENRLVWLCCDAFGGKPLWSKGPKGGKGDYDNGVWTFLAEGQRAELIAYTYTVLVRGALKAREAFSRDTGYAGSRVQKAALLDQFSTAYVMKLAAKVEPFALGEREVSALKAKTEEISKGGEACTRGADLTSYYAVAAGLRAGEAAQFHAATGHTQKEALK